MEPTQLLHTYLAWKDIRGGVTFGDCWDLHLSCPPRSKVDRLGALSSFFDRFGVGRFEY